MGVQSVDESVLRAALSAADDAAEELISLHQALVRVPSVNTGVMPTGNETAVCDVLGSFLHDHGIAYELHSRTPTRGNLVARLDGQPTHPSLLLLSHTDVVPVEDASVWKHAPFGGDIAGGRIWGRGSSDAKSLVSTSAMALVLLKRLDLRLRGSLLMLAAADEESGGAYGAGWMAEYRADRVAADVAINEGAGSPLATPQGIAYTIANGEKGRYEVTITVGGTSGHASSPWRANNALARANDVLRRLFAYQPTLSTAHPLFGDIARQYGIPNAITPENVGDVATAMQAQHDTVVNVIMSSSRMTLTPTMCSAGVKSNSIPASATIVCDVRALPSQDAAYVRQEVAHALEGLEGVSVEVKATASATESPFDATFLGHVLQSLRFATGQQELALLPILTGGFTDSRFFRPLGTRVYGFMPVHTTADTRDSGVHGVDESIEIEALKTRLRFLLALALQYVG